MLSNMKISTTLALVSGMASIASAERPGGGLRGLQQMPADAVVCLTAEQCEEKFNSLNWDGYFYADDSFPTKGCFSKNNNGNLYFGTGGSVAEMSETNVPGLQERVWCDVQTDVPTPSPVQKQVEWVVEKTPPVTDTPSKEPTLKPVAAVVCLTAEQCEEKFNSLNWDGYFYADDSFPTKGCFSKNNNGNLYFGTGGSVAEMSETNVPGSKERVWCDAPMDQITLRPVTDSPTEQPSPLPSNSPSSKPTMQPTTKPTVS